MTVRLCSLRNQRCAAQVFRQLPRDDHDKTSLPDFCDRVTSAQRAYAHRRNHRSRCKNGVLRSEPSSTASREKMARGLTPTTSSASSAQTQKIFEFSLFSHDFSL